MNLDTITFHDEKWNYEKNGIVEKEKADIVFVFGDRDIFKDPRHCDELKTVYPNAHIVGCTSSGNILDDTVRNEPLVATAVEFASGFTRICVIDFDEKDDLVAVGKRVVEGLPREGLKHVFILSDGLRMNGSMLAIGANLAHDGAFPITGGLAGDGNAFEETWVIADDVPKQGRVVAVGFYGDAISVSSVCYAGWDEFGILRHITRSEGNIVYEIDGKPALKLYKKYLGEFADDLPESALRFPLSIKQSEEDTPVIRSVIGVDEEHQSMIFAGDVPEGSLARLMKTDIDGLIDGLKIAAGRIARSNDRSALGLVVSCVGRRVVLDQLTDEELETIRNTVGDKVQLTGFYSYGELAPFSDTFHSCQLHNQAMTLTVVYEKEQP
jgi:hypothetical protein